MANSPSFCALKKALETGSSILFESLWDAPKALTAVFAAQLIKKNLLLITGGTREDSLFDSIETLAPNLAIECPAWETLPGEDILPSPDIIGKRFDALHALTTRKTPAIVICPLQSLLQKVLPKTDLAPLLVSWKKGSKVSFSSLPTLLTKLGYKQSAVVSDKGEFALRGGILDLFPISSPDPFRIEFWGDEIEEIRIFDPVGQKSVGSADTVILTPANESALLEKAKRLGSIADYLGDDFLVLWDDLLAIEDSYASLKKMAGASSSLLYSLEEILGRLKDQPQIFGASDAIEKLSALVHLGKNRSKYLQPVSFEVFGKQFEASRWMHPFAAPEAFFAIDGSDVESAQILDLLPKDVSIPTLLVNANDTEEEEIKRQIAKRGVVFSKGASFKKGYLSSGFVIQDLPLAVLPNAEITKRTRVRRQKWRTATHSPAAEFHALSPGDPVVHFHSGIGKYLGTEKHVNHLGVETEFLALQYADDSKLFVPLNQAYLVSRYIGAGEEIPTLSQLGSKRWTNTRVAAQQQIVGYANDLLQLYAARVVEGGFRYPADSSLMQQFERDFPYAETSDQLLAIAAIKQDMMSDKPMDRLICGDVGYGKTEVAMRAAFKATADGKKQVAVLVPTTVLAMQHFETFSARMNGFPVRIGVLSRFRTAKQNKETLRKAADGEIDILIGTHRILSKDVLFKNLGLLIIDEEQRFGVRAKEHLKKMKAGVDCLTLSATPIPRTLYMSLVHARDMSVIGTPPQDRLPVKTILAETEEELIRNALLREFARGGQAFYIHNRVESIFERASAISKIVPTARIGVVHGQMDPDEIDPVFHQFKEGSLDLLFATTIIENGIDIPNANTILIDRADTYGLADLYQLRGRVGRWNRSAYAYFLIPKHIRLAEVSRKRLNALIEAGGYGGGMKIAMRDLEIRGAGDILGVQQSGQVSAIGFHLYCKMLKRAIDALKKQAPISFNETKMEFPFDARIPEEYIAESSLRMEIYYRFGEATSFQEADELFDELKDRFGTPPLPALWLYHLARLRIFACANQFTLLKLQNYSLTAERLSGKQTSQHTFLVPKKVQMPAELERYLLEHLRPICENK